MVGRGVDAFALAPQQVGFGTGAVSNSTHTNTSSVEQVLVGGQHGGAVKGGVCDPGFVTGAVTNSKNMGFVTGAVTNPKRTNTSSVEQVLEADGTVVQATVGLVAVAANPQQDASTSSEERRLGGVQERKANAVALAVQRSNMGAAALAREQASTRALALSAVVNDESLLDKQDIGQMSREEWIGASTASTTVVVSDKLEMSQDDVRRKVLQAESFLDSIRDDGESSIAVDTTPGRKNNKVIPPDALTGGERSQVWESYLGWLEKHQSRGYKCGDPDFPPINLNRVRKTVMHGVNAEFIEGAPDPLPRSSNRNLIKEDNSAEAVWTDQQVKAMHDGKMIRLEKYPGEARILAMLFLVDKGGGSGFRLIMDVREFNKWCKKTGFTLHTLSGGRYVYWDLVGMATDDLTSSYGHLRLHEDIQRYVAFTWRGVTYIVLAAPYGMRILPEIFQATASIAPRINYLIGLSPLLVTAQDWTDVAMGRRKMPDAKDRYVICIKQYLDDYMKACKAALRSKSNVLVPQDEVLPLFKLLSESFRALMMSMGWVLSPKSQRDVEAVNEFTGFNVHTALKGGRFGIPVKKVNKNVKIFKDALAKEWWSLREMAAMASRILQFKLIWFADASMFARPLYFRLAKEVTNRSSWNDLVRPGTMELDMIREALNLLEGPNCRLTAGVIDSHKQCVRCFDSQYWDVFNSEAGDPPTIVAGDVSDYMMANYTTSMSLDLLASVVERKIREEGHHLSLWKKLSVQEQRRDIESSDEIVWWKLLFPDERTRSSAYRELLNILRFYQDTKIFEALVVRMEQAPNKRMIHTTDSQCVALMLAKGAAGVPDCHNLVMQIRTITKPLRKRFDWFCAWLPREAVASQIADEMSKTKNHLIRRSVFASLTEKFGFDFEFNLDAYATEDEVVQGSNGKPLAFCSRSWHQSSLGDGRTFSWSGYTVWAFPPPEVDMLVEEALNKATHHDGVAVVCLAQWQYRKFSGRYRSLPYTKKYQLEAGSSIRIKCGPGSGKNEIQYEPSRFKLMLLVFDNRQKGAVSDGGRH